MEGFAGTIIFCVWLNNVNNSNNGNNHGQQSYNESFKPVILILAGYAILLTLLSAFGLISYRILRSTPLLKIYKYAAWLIAVFINTVLVIISVISISVIKRQNSEISTDSIEIGKTNTYVIWFVILGVLQIALHIYLAITLQTFVHRQVRHEKRRTTLRESTFTKPQRQLSVKVDKFYDVTE
ncbi:5896_t:CDS:2, partial [Cetraspora pellucida]